MVVITIILLMWRLFIYIRNLNSDDTDKNIEKRFNWVTGENSWPNLLVNMCVELTQIVSESQIRCNYFTTAPHKNKEKYIQNRTKYFTIAIVRDYLVKKMNKDMYKVYQLRLSKAKLAWRVNKKWINNNII